MCLFSIFEPFRTIPNHSKELISHIDETLLCSYYVNVDMQ